jgi:hypothetical protein
MLIAKSRLFGGSGGIAFDETRNHILRIERVIVHHSEYVHGLEVTYILENGERLPRSYGGHGGEESPEIVFSEDERICGVTVRSGQYVDSLAFITYRMFNLIGMRRYGPYGGMGGQSCTVLSPNVREFFGRSGSLLDAIGFRCEEPLLEC